MLYASKYGCRIPEWAIEKDLGELYEHWLLFISKNRGCILVAMLKSSLTHRTVIKEEEKDH